MPFDLEKEALIASEIVEENRVTDYTHKLGTLHQQFVRDMKPGHDPLHKAKVLFDWLWITKPTRYKHRSHYKIHDAIDSQLRRDSQVVGNCLGLTLLYNTLARGLELDVEALYLENAFGIGPHVLTILKVGKTTIDIENTLPEGFDHKGHLNDPSRTRWGDRELVADIYHSRANECYERGKYKDAVTHYERAIALNPRYEKALLNKAIVLDRIKKGND